MAKVVVVFDYYSEDFIGVFNRVREIIPPSIDSVMDIFELEKNPFWSPEAPPSKEALFNLFGFCLVCNGREISEFDRLAYQVRTREYHVDYIDDRADFHILIEKKNNDYEFLFQVPRKYAETQKEREMFFDVYKTGYLEGGTTEFDNQYW